LSRVLHVLPTLSRGGASRAVLALARATAEAGRPYEHRLVSLRPGVPAMAERAVELGVDLAAAGSRDEVAAEIAAADLVHVHFWNSPEVFELLSSPLPDCRLAIWSHISGTTAPQVLVGELADVADALVATSPTTLHSGPSAGAAVAVVPNAAELDRLEGVERRDHDGFVVAYVGTVDPVKMHSRFVELSAAVEVAEVRFVVCGIGDGFGAIAERAARLGVRERFELRGYVDDVGSVLAEADVFGYPLTPGNYSGSELVLAEAMYMGVPPVLLPYGGAAESVEDGVSGIVVSEEDEYPRAIERLAADPALRARLGEGARRHVGLHRSPRVVGSAWARIYEDLLARPKATPRWSGPPAPSGAEAFIRGLGGTGEEFELSLGGDAAVDERIAAAPLPLVTGDGGILDYRRRYPDDPHLRFWSGLVLARAGRPALAAGELSAAVRLGVERERVRPHLDAVVGAAPAGAAS
jgi:glycosyltransferase involved in cell wall biosynthesis